MSEVDSFLILGTLILSDLLPFDPMLQVESSQGSDCDSLVGKLAMKESGSPFESKSRHKFQGLIARQPVDVFLVKFEDEFLWRDFPGWLDSFPADMLDRVVGNA